MHIQSQERDGKVIIGLSGRFDAYEASRVAESLYDAAKTAGARVVVDLSDVSFIDSTALAVLVQGLKRCRQNSGDLFVSGLQPPVRIVFELTRLDRAFELFESVQDALDAFGPAVP